jgi:hypothetical protein
MSDFLSKRVKKRDPVGLSTTRYEFLSLDEAEPDLGNPLVGPSSIGVKPFPDGSAFILASFASSTRGDRYWVPPSSLTGLGLGVIPGAFTIRSNNSTVGLANSFTTLNFVGSGISVDQVGINAEEQTGIATVRVVYPGFGDVRTFQYHGDSGFLAGATQFVFNPNGNNVGIGSTLPTSKLDIIGNIKISGISTLNVLNVNTILSTSIENSGVTTTNSLSIGSTQVISSDRQLQNITSLDSITTETIETAIANAPNTFTDLNVSGVGTFGGILYANSGINASGISSIVNLVGDSANIKSTAIENLTVSGVSTIGFLTANNSFVSGISTVGFISATNGRIVNTLTVGFVTANTLNVSSSATITSLNTTNLVSTNLSSNNLNVSIAGTITTLNSTDIISNTIQNTSDLVSGRIGIGTTPEYELDVDGDIKTNGLIYVSNGNGITGQVLLSRGIDPPVWGAPENVTVGAAQSIFITDQINDSDLYYLTLTKEVNNVGFINVDSDGLIYDPSNNNFGIGTSLPGFNLDVNGNINFSGILYKNGEVYIASRWGADETESTLYKLGNVGIGTTVVPSTFTVKGDSLFDGPVNFIDDIDINATTNIKGSVSEKVVSNFDANFSVNAGKLTLDISQSTVVVGVLTSSISTWEFVGVNTGSARATTITLIIDSDSLLSYGDLFSIVGLGTVGIVTTGNVRWSGGIAPLPTNNDDILSFTVISDQSGRFRVYGTSSLNFS